MPNVDINQIMRAACERDRERITYGAYGAYGVSMFDASLGLMATFGGESGWMKARRVAATVEWVRQSCERERHPAWLVELVAQRVKVAALANDFPLVEER